jgi:hypothetical protein
VFFHSFANQDRDGKSLHPDLAALIQMVGRQLFGDRFLSKTEEYQRKQVTTFL